MNLNSPPPDPFRLLLRALLVSLLGAIVLLSGVWVAEHYGGGLLLVAWGGLFLLILAIGPRLEMPQWVKEALSVSKPIAALPPTLQGQMFPDADSMRDLRIQVGRKIEVEGRRDAELKSMLDGKDMTRVRSAIEAMKSEGTWPYYASGLLLHGFDLRMRDANVLLLDEGAYFPRYGDNYEPATFRAARNFETPALHQGLLERLLSLGCDINDRDIEGRNLLEKTIEALGDSSKVYSSLMSTQAAQPFLDSIELTLNLHSQVRPEYVDLLEKYGNRISAGSNRQVDKLVRRMRSDQAGVVLDEKTGEASGAPRTTRL